MTDLSNKILSKYQVRKTRAQKQAFCELLQKEIPEVTVQTSKAPLNRNLIIGNIEKADIIISAHYDTCAQMPVPNFIMPLNPTLSIVYSLILIIPMFLAVFLLNKLLGLITDNFWIHYFVSIAMLFSFMALMIIGPANQHTVNDNTSGVITLCEIYAQLSSELKDNVALIFFDNEEKGLIGSSCFRKTYKKEMNNKLLINLDCVSDGNHLLFAASKLARKKYGPIFDEIFQPANGKNVLLKKAEKVYYPSDQAGFPLALAVAALKHKKGIGYYMDRIHTKRDTVMDVENIEYLRDHIVELIQKA